MSGDNNQMVTHPHQNPRMMDVLFILTLLLSQAGSVAAGDMGVIYGP